MDNADAAKSRINSNTYITVGSQAPPTSLHAHSLNGFVLQALPMKEYLIEKQLRGLLQKQPGVVCDLTQLSSQFLGCLHPPALKKELLRLKDRHKELEHSQEQN